jgi:hypothetical protein
MGRGAAVVASRVLSGSLLGSDLRNMLEQNRLFISITIQTGLTACFRGRLSVLRGRSGTLAESALFMGSLEFESSSINSRFLRAKNSIQNGL